MRWLRPESKDLLEDSTRRATASNAAYAGMAYRSNWNVQRAVRDGYERVIWVFRAVDHIASAASRLPVQLRAGSEHGPVVDDVLAARDPLMRLLNRRSNAWEISANFRYRLSSQLLLSKKGVFIEVVRSRLGAPLALHLLPCGDTSPVPDPVRFVSEFEVTVNGVPQRIPAFEDDGVTPRVLWIRRPHPTDPYSGITPMEAAGLSVDMDYYARLYNRSFLQNDGRPGGLLGVRGNMDPDDKDELRRRFGGGPSQAGRTTVVKADDLNWVDTAVTPRDAQFAEVMRLTKTDILDAFGVPESLIGNASGRTFDNAGQEQENFWQETMPPHMDVIAGSFDHITAGGIEDDRYLVHDTEGVPILQKAREKREKSLKELFEAGLITADEFREETGRDPFGTPGAGTLWIAGTKRSIDAPPAANVPAVQASAEGLDVKRPVSRETKALTSSAAEVERRVDARAADLRKVMRRYFNRQERVVLERLSGVKARRGTPLWDPPGTKAVEVGDVLDADRWDEELSEDLGPEVVAIYADEADAAGAEVPEEGAGKAVAARLGAAAAINATTGEKLEKALVVGDGETAADVRSRVQEVYEEARTSRSDLIAETEAAGATNDARDLIAAVVGAERKKWRSRGDAKVRESHATAHGQEKDVGEAFTVGGSTMRYPGDPAAPIRETARCRCWVEYLASDMGSG